MDILVIGRLAVKLAGQSVPEFEANFENFGILHLRNFHQIPEPIKQLVRAVVLHQLGVVFEVNLEKKPQILDKSLKYEHVNSTATGFS